MKELILKHIYDDILPGGRMGINRTIEKARAQYSWPNMYSDIVNYVKSCERFSNKKQPMFPVRASLEPMLFMRVPGSESVLIFFVRYRVAKKLAINMCYYLLTILQIC